MSLSRKELMDVDSSLSQLEKLIAEAPWGRWWWADSLRAAPWRRNCFNFRSLTEFKAWFAWGRAWFVPWNCVFD